MHVVIIGFASYDTAGKVIYETDSATGSITAIPAKNISPYLVEGKDMAVVNRSKPLCDMPGIGIGNKPIDDGNYLFTPEEKAEFLQKEPSAMEFFRKWIGAEELINHGDKWCLWLGDCPPEKLTKMPQALARVGAVRDFRLKSKSAPTQKLAQTPTRFHVENMPKHNYLVIPRHSSETRVFIPIEYFSPEYVVGDSCLIIPDAKLYHFGILSSAMHMAWVRQVCGRLKSDYRYSSKLVYNNYPWPEKPSEKQVRAVEEAAQSVLDARKEFPQSTLAHLYNPLTMPPVLVKAHAALDRAVDAAYRTQPFPTERLRVEFLFSLYETLTKPLLAKGKKK